MPRRALLKFRNSDSTQDLNDRFKGLFNRGFFWSGALSIPGGSLKVDLAPFATAGADGMFVREDSETTRLDVVAGVKNYIVIRQEYISNADPVVSIESLTESEFNSDGPIGEKGINNPTLIVFGVVNVPSGSTQTNTDMIETTESDIVDTLGRSSFRGLLSAEAALPVSGLHANRAGDFFIITDGAGDVPGLFAWNGASWINITNAQAVLALLIEHSGNEIANEIHLTTLQAQAVAGSEGTPQVGNLFVTETDERLLTQDEADANAGNGLPLEDFDPSDTNRWISSSKVFAVPTEVVVDVGKPASGQTLDTTEIELPYSIGGFFVGVYDSEMPLEAVAGTVQQWFNIYTADTAEDEEYTNDEFNEVQILQVRSANPGTDAFDASSVEVDSSVVGTTDDLGFFVNSAKSLYLVLSNEITGPVRVAYGKRDSLGALLPQLLMNRGPKGGQIDTRLVRLLFGTPNAQFDDPDLWDSSVLAGDVVAFNAGTNKFVQADPDGVAGPSGLDPVGVRGNFNNLIMEGLYTRVSGSYSIDLLYADKASPGSLTNVENEWFIGRAISATQLLVNMNSIALSSSEPTTPVAFPSNLFSGSLQAGMTCYWSGSLFEKADSVTNLPLGIRGNNNNVIQSGKYVALTGSPFVSGTRYYASTVAGSLTDAENDWFMGIGIDSTTLLVNANAVPIPHKWSEEHHTVTGYHEFQIGDASDRDAISSPGSGMFFIRDDLTASFIEYYNGSAWVSASSGSVPSGSKMLFIQDTVPTGWTLDVSANDKVIRVVNVAASGGVTGGSWTISGFQADDHALVESEMAAHRHHGFGARQAGFPFGDVLPDDKQGAASGVDYNNRYYNTSTTGGGAAADDSPGPGLPHDHTVSNNGAWRPSYVNAIVCTKD